MKKALCLVCLLLMLCNPVAHADPWGNMGRPYDSLELFVYMAAIDIYAAFFMLVALFTGFRKTLFVEFLCGLGFFLYGLHMLYQISYYSHSHRNRDEMIKLLREGYTAWILLYALLFTGLLVHILYFLFAKKKVKGDSHG